MASKTAEIRGIKVKTASQRRFIVIGMQHIGDGKATYFIAKRSDNVATVKSFAHKMRDSHRASQRVDGIVTVIVDTVAGKEVAF